jgi:hypothetical protein
MKQQSKKLTIVLTALVILLSAAVSASADVEWIYGKAVNAKGELEFLEEHALRYKNGRIDSIKTSYYDAEHRKIGEQVSDFSHGPQLGSYDFKDERLQYLDGARVMSDRILIYCKETPEAGTKKKTLQRESSQIVGHGFHHFIVANLDRLKQGDVISAKLVVPAHMDQFDIRISKHKIEDGFIRVKIELDNWFLRLFAPHMEAEYDLSSQRLLSYKGIGLIADATGKTVQVAVSYDYAQQKQLLSSWSKTDAARLGRN